MGRYYQPTASEVKKARLESKLTQQSAADMCLITQHTWAGYEQGRIVMPPPMWELFILKVAAETLRNKPHKQTKEEKEKERLEDLAFGQAILDSDWRTQEEIDQDDRYEVWRQDRIAKGILPDTPPPPLDIRGKLYRNDD